MEPGNGRVGLFAGLVQEDAPRGNLGGALAVVGVAADEKGLADATESIHNEVAGGVDGPGVDDQGLSVLIPLERLLEECQLWRQGGGRAIAGRRW